ncbi:MAG: OmpW family outer membrane protein [Agitococcus sp.]
MRTLALCLAVSSLTFAPVAMAESPWTVKVGFSQVNPKSDNGSLAGGTFESDVSSEVGFTPSIEYKIAPNVVGEVLLAIPFEHEVKDTKSDTKIASFKHLPPTFSAKYLFTPDAAFSPLLA